MEIAYFEKRWSKWLREEKAVRYMYLCGKDRQAVASCNCY